MMRRNKKIIFLLLAELLLDATKVNAYTFGVGYADTGGHHTSTPREDIVVQETVESGDQRTIHTCTYNYSISVNKNITINGYDMLDNEIMQTSLTIADENKILAGTSIGLNIYETKSISWKVTKAEATFSTQVRYKTYVCEYDDAEPPQEVPASTISNRLKPNENQNGSRIETLSTGCSRKNNPYYNTYYYTRLSDIVCPTYEGCKLVRGPAYAWQSTTYTEVSSGTDNATYLKDCQKTAAEAAITAANTTIHSSYYIKMTDSNDANGTEMVNITNEDANRTKEYYKNGAKMDCGGGACIFKYEESGEEPPSEDAMTVKFYYKKNNVCIDVKNGKISYRDTDCTDNEIKVPNKKISGLEHWHYFVPLNSTRNSDVVINLLPAYGASLSKEECNYVMKNNPIHLDEENNILKSVTSYLDLIIPKEDGKTFSGNYCLKYQDEYDAICNDVSSDYTEIVDNGCRLTSQIKIPINQKFYNEITSGVTGENVKLKGFNFYYKPIDINNPFPNGIAENSLWKKWSDEPTKTPDISKSYNKATYTAKDINARKIRQYNKSNNYTSWETMTLEGKSSFITKENIVTRESDTGSVYRLGCGPANVNEYLDEAKTIKNILYQEECS